MAEDDRAAAEEGVAEEEAAVEDEAPMDEEAAEEEPAEEDGLNAEAEDDEAPPEDEAEAEAAEEEEETFPNMLESCYGKKFVVKQRQKLRTAKHVEAFCSQLQDKVDEVKAAGETLVFEDFDISQNLIPTELLETIFASLADGGVHVERFRAFGVPTLNDQTATFLAGWLAGVTQETVPYELHLSDCAITTDGFHDLVKALEENDAFPGPDPKSPSRRLPLYLRLEHNYIEEQAIKDAVKSEVIAPMKKAASIRLSSKNKARLLMIHDGSYGQKRGEPPAPEDAPPPRPVREKGSGKGEKGSGKGKTKTRESDRSRPSGRERERDRDRDRGKGHGRDRDRERAASRAPPWQALPSSRQSSGSSRTPGSRRDVAARPAPARRTESSGGHGRSAPYNAFSRGDRDRERDRDNRDRDRGRDRDRDGDRRGSTGGSARPTLKRGNDSSGRDEASKRHRSSAGGASANTSKGSGKRHSNEGSSTRQAPKSRGPAMPHPWEEHFSAEYNIAYFWNSKTGESLWERPRF